MAVSILKRLRPDDKEEMTFIDHLEALRWHIVRSLAVVLLLSIAAFIYIDWIFTNVITGPLNNDFISYRSLCSLSHYLRIGDALCMPAMNIKLQTTTFSSQFMNSITIAFFTGFLAAFPYVFYELFQFIKPALTPTELKHSRGGIFWVSFCFFLGAAFGYFLLAPFTFNFLANYTLGTNLVLESKPTLDDYLENLLNLILGCAIAFELPVLSYVLTRIGIISPTFLITYRKYAAVIILVVAAIITPSPDWTSQLLVFVPLMLLYQISIGVSKRAYVEEEKKMKEWS